MEKAFDPSFLEEMKHILLDEKGRLEGELTARSAKSTREADHREPAYEDFGDKPEDNATEMADFDVTFNVETTLEEQMKRVQEALQRIADGTYGIDEETGLLISEERLRANPTATTDIDTA